MNFLNMISDDIRGLASVTTKERLSLGILLKNKVPNRSANVVILLL